MLAKKEKIVKIDMQILKICHLQLLFLFVLMNKERRNMKKYNITYCMDGEVIFTTNNDEAKEKIIVNYLSTNLNRECIKKLVVDNITYYEILIESAIKVIKKNQYDLYNNLEKHLLNFIKALLANTADELITYITEANFYTKEELVKIELEFERKHLYSKIKKKKYKRT